MKEKIYLLDLDGTMYHGTNIIESAKIFLDYLIENNKPFLFLTNNARRTKRQNVEHMEKMGYQNIQENTFFTSSMAASKYIAKKGKQRRCFYIGEDGLKEALLEEGFIIDDHNVDYVFVGLNNNADYKLYSKALSLLLEGAILVGTNEDRKLPTEDGYSVGNGAIVHMFEYASSQTSEKIGKPSAVILEEALSYLNVSKDDVVIVGDNLETDIKLGYDHGVDTIFVTSGVHNREDIELLKIVPTKVIDSLEELINK